jgi:hypothetical protein
VREILNEFIGDELHQIVIRYINQKWNYLIVYEYYKGMESVMRQYYSYHHSKPYHIKRPKGNENQTTLPIKKPTKNIKIENFITTESLNKFLGETRSIEYVDLKVNAYEQGGVLYTLIYKEAGNQ